MTGEKETIGSRVRRLRLARGLSQNQLARLVGMSRQSIFEMENQRRKYLLPETLQKMATAFDITEEELAYGYKPVEHPEEIAVEAVLRAQGVPEEDIATVMKVVDAIRSDPRDRPGQFQATA